MTVQNLINLLFHKENFEVELTQYTENLKESLENTPSLPTTPNTKTFKFKDIPKDLLEKEVLLFDVLMEDGNPFFTPTLNIIYK